MYIRYGLLLLLFIGLLFELWRLDHWLYRPKNRRAYEQFVAEKLKGEGWEKVKLGTGRSDDGWDVMGYHKGQKWVVQVKMHKSNVGVAVVREILGVAVRYKARAMVVTTKGFTKEALTFASSTGVIVRVMSIRDESQK